MKWRRINTILHRDIGYLSIGLTIVYAVSGIAVNHIEDWNPSYRLEIREFTIPLPEDPDRQQIVRTVMDHLDEDIAVESTFRPAPDRFQIFYSGNTLEVNLRTGMVRQELVHKRALLFDFNFLHLNHAKKLWTWVADLYAIALIILALTGLFVLPGKRGIKGRGAWLSVLGLLIPVIFLILYR